MGMYRMYYCYKYDIFSYKEILLFLITYRYTFTYCSYEIIIRYSSFVVFIEYWIYFVLGR